MEGEKWTTDIVFNIGNDDIHYDSDLELNTGLEIVKEPNTDIMPDPNDQRHTEILVCLLATFSVTKKLINSLLLFFLYLYSFENPSQLSLMLMFKNSLQVCCDAYIFFINKKKTGQ